MKIVALILAKSKSDRLTSKNTLPFHGKPMFMENVEKCLKIFDKVYVSSDDNFILQMAYMKGALAIKRPKKLCGDTPNIPVYQHAFKFMNEPDAIVAVQANSPTIELKVIQKVKDFIEKGAEEVMTCHPVNPDNPIYGSVWALSKDRLLNYGDPYKPNPDKLVDDYSIDIHTLNDYNLAIKLYGKKK